MTMDILTTRQSSAWTRVINGCTAWDFYHLPQYHALAENLGEGTAYLFHYRAGPYSIALPLVVRPLDDVDGLDTRAAGWQDATSVYGYPGPIASHADMPSEVITGFQQVLAERLHDLHVVAVFSRFHPLLGQKHLLAGLGDCEAIGKTVSIDLTLPPDEQFARYRWNFQRIIRKARRSGLSLLHDRTFSRLDEFIAIYYETMRRVGAARSYYFSAEYFKSLKETLNGHLHLMCCLHGGRVIGGALFGAANGIVQTHLTASATDALPLAPTKLLVDEIRLWGTQHGYKALHLGGGATSRADDPLLFFKLGFSHRTHDFSVWRWTVYPEVYERLKVIKSRWNQLHGHEIEPRVFFPEYRRPTLPATTMLAPAGAI